MIKLKLQFLLQLMIPTCLLAIGIKEVDIFDLNTNNTELKVSINDFKTINQDLEYHNKNFDIVIPPLGLQSLEGNKLQYILPIFLLTTLSMYIINDIKDIYRESYLYYSDITTTLLKNQIKTFLNISQFKIFYNQYFYHIKSFYHPNKLSSYLMLYLK
jgi:hypothetical protein